MTRRTGLSEDRPIWAAGEEQAAHALVSARLLERGADPRDIAQTDFVLAEDRFTILAFVHFHNGDAKAITVRG